MGSIGFRVRREHHGAPFLLLFAPRCCKITKVSKRSECAMFEGDYSKNVWIAAIVLAAGSLVMDVLFLLGSNDSMKNSVWFTMPFAAFVLYKGIQGLIKKIREEKEDQ
jgi:hypothetical protein